jgi:hypothetical protein
MPTFSRKEEGVPLETDPAVLQARVAELENDLADLRLLHENIVEHGTTLENELINLVRTLSEVATDLEKGRFDPQSLSWLIERPDELGQLGRVFKKMGHEVHTRDRRLRMLRVVIPAGVALSAEKHFNRLLETIVIEAQKLCNADAGALALITRDQKLQFVIVRNDSLEIRMGGTSGNEVTLPLLPLYDEHGQPNHANVATYVALTHQRVNIPNAYAAEVGNFSGPQTFDAHIDYHAVSLLTIPLEDEHNEVLGVLQLINAKDSETGQRIPFSPDDVVETLVLLAVAALSSYLREEKLHKEIEQLRIQINHELREKQIAEITETDYFQALQRRAQELRKRK